MEQFFQNFYHCPSDGTMWDDVWSCMCNDRCPVCNKEIEPYKSIDVTKNETDDGK